MARLGYEATDQTTRALVSGLNAVADLSGEGLVRRVRQARKAAAYQMETVVAHQILRGLRRL
jgi:hypothetical protein